METEVIRYCISKDRYANMSQDDIDEIVSWYSGSLIRIEEDEHDVVLIILAPVTWKYLVLSALLLPYRYI